MKQVVDIIIVNWNGGELLQNCVKSVLMSDITGIDVTLYIVDNGSVDQSIASLPEDHRIQVILNRKNLGFGKACNVALAKCTAPFILLLNPDSEINNNTLKQSLAFMNNRPDVAVLGVKQLDRNGHVLRGCSRLPKPKHFINSTLGLSRISPSLFPQNIMHDWDHKTSAEVDHVIGSFMLIRRSVIDRVGFMDERYFVYLEDLDLSVRIKRAGYKIFYNSDISIMHEGGGISKQIKARRLFYSLHSKILFAKKYFNALWAFLIILLTLFVEPVIRLIFSLIRLNFQEMREAAMAYAFLYKSVFALQRTSTP